MPEKPLLVLLIHGFGGGAYEVAPLASLLEADGIPCRIVRLAGHGPGKTPIEPLPYHAWIDSARRAYAALRPHYRVFCVGFSMGGLIAAQLNYERPFAGLALISTPIYFWNLPQVARNLQADFSAEARRYLIESYGRTPLPAMLQFLRLRAAVAGKFSHINCPVLIAQAMDDDTVWPQSAEYLARRVRGPHMVYRALSGGHLLLCDPYECAEIARRLRILLKTYL